ncbi:MAG: hypothetical protein HKN22_08925 [Bacteroidia bacterium]|nr:hypothetical protein [Bacteroidia bacterium]
MKLFKIAATLIAVSMSIGITAQTCTPTAPVCVPVNGYAFQYAPNTNYGLLFNTTTSQYEFTDGTGAGIFHVNAVNGLVSVDNRLAVGIGNPGATDFSVFNGVAQFGVPTGFAEFQLDGDLTFVGTADYLVGADRYAFRYALAPGYGLFFNATASQYEFRTLNASPVFTIGANSGDLDNTGDLSVGGSATIAGNVSLGSNLSAVGTASISGSAAIGSNLTVAGTITASGDIQTSSDFLAGGDLDCGGNVNVLTGKVNAAAVIATDSIVSSDNIKAYGNLETKLDLIVEDDADIGGNINVGGSATVAGNVSLGSNFSVVGTAAIGGSASVGSNLSVGGTVSANGDILTSSDLFAGGDINATSGDLNIINVNASGTVNGTGGSTAGDFAVKGQGGNTPTNGYLGVVGSDGFDGEDSLKINGWDIGVLGASSGTTTIDNVGVLGFADHIGVAARHKFSGNSVDLATDIYSIYAEGFAEISGDVGINFPPIPGVDLRLALEHGVLQLGSTVQLTDAAPFNLSINSQVDPSVNLFHNIGSITNAWSQVFAGGFIVVSDRRNKKSIEPLTYGLDEVMALKPVSYVLKEDPKQEVKLGFIAQEAMEVIPESFKQTDMRMDAEGNMQEVAMDRMGMDYMTMIPVLINAVQEQQAIIEVLEEEIKLQNRKLEKVDKISGEVDDLRTELGLCCEKNSFEEYENDVPSNHNIPLNKPWLGQNIPNPFKGSTVIDYYIPGGIQSAEIKVYTTDGRVVAVYDISEGLGAVTFGYFSGSTTTYFYSLFCDGKLISSKSMIEQ